MPTASNRAARESKSPRGDAFQTSPASMGSTWSDPAFSPKTVLLIGESMWTIDVAGGRRRSRNAEKDLRSARSRALIQVSEAQEARTI